MKTSVSEFLPVRGLRYHVRIWGPVRAPQLFLLHGWMDVSATFQFLVDALVREWRVIAPDWRGFGQSAWRNDAYWFADYLGDLDALLQRYSSNEPCRLVGHSMGGNVACLYAGVRPERVAGLVTVEGFGLPPTQPEQAPARYHAWLEQLRAGPPAATPLAPQRLEARLGRENPRLSPEQAAFLARHLAVPSADGQVVRAGDPWHRLVHPVLYRLEEAKACWRQIQAPVLWVGARESPVMRQFAAHPEDYRARLACFRDLREIIIEDAGHNVHHDQPRRLAEVIEQFLAA